MSNKRAVRISITEMNNGLVRTLFVDKDGDTLYYEDVDDMLTAITLLPKTYRDKIWNKQKEIQGE